MVQHVHVPGAGWKRIILQTLEKKVSPSRSLGHLEIQPDPVADCDCHTALRVPRTKQR